MIYALFVQLLPRKAGEELTRDRLVMHHETFDTEQEAENEQRKLRGQNLPFRTWIVSFEDPR